MAPFHPCGEQILRVARVAIRLINRLEKAEIETIGQLAQQASTSGTAFLPLLSLANVPQFIGEIVELHPQVILHQPSHESCDLLRPLATLHQVDHHRPVVSDTQGSVRELSKVLVRGEDIAILILPIELLGQLIGLRAVDQPCGLVQPLDIGSQRLLVSLIIGAVLRDAQLTYRTKDRAEGGPSEGAILQVKTEVVHSRPDRRAGREV